MRCTIGLSMTIPLRISKITKSKGPDLDRNFMNMFRTCEKLPKDSWGGIAIKYLSKMWYLWSKKMNMVTELRKLSFCTEANQILIFERLQNNLFLSHPIQWQS